MKETRTFTVPIKDKNKRIDLYLTFVNNDLTRSFIKSLIIKGNIFVNGRQGIHSAYKVQEDDKIELIVEDNKPTSVEGEDIDLDVIYEDENYLVINKPYGMVVHPANGNWTGTLANAIIHRFSTIKNVGESFRPGIVHRLDKETSGTIIVAKNNESMWWLTKQFADRRIEKKYICFALGKIELDKISKQKFTDIKVSVEGDEIIVESGLERSKANRKIVSVDPEGKKSLTYIKPIFTKNFTVFKNNYYFTLCEVKPHTGRTHQIRVHLKALGFPIWGDLIYMSNKQLNIVNEICKKYNLSNRLFLHAQELKIKEKSGEEKNFKSDLPQELKKIIKETN